MILELHIELPILISMTADRQGFQWQYQFTGLGSRGTELSY